MNPFGNWIFGRSLQLSEEALRRALRAADGLEETEAIIHQINTKLDVLIRAPYRAAQIHWRAGNTAECESKLVDALALNELDAPARLLYIRLLINQGKVQLARDEYFNFLGMFGFQGDRVPSELFDAYVHDYFQSRITARRSHGFEIRDEYDYFPDEIRCSRNAIAVQFKREGSILNWFSVPYLVNVRDWQGNAIVDLAPSKHLRIRALTNAYLVVSESPTQCAVYSLQSGSMVSALTHAEADSLFVCGERHGVYSNRWMTKGTTLEVLGATLRAVRKEARWEAHVRTSYGVRTTETRTAHYGAVEVCWKA